MNLCQRLARLEQARVQTSALTHVFLDEDGRIYDDGSAAVRPWIGRHYDELTASLPRDAPLKVYLFDPHEVCP
jgi:hypothetical protein